MSKKIWLINQFAMPPKYEVRVQTLKRAQYLRSNGFDVVIISGSYLHNTNINLIEDKSSYKFVEYDEGQSFIHIKTSNYTSNGFKRIYSTLEFYIKLWWNASSFERPDYISHLAAVPFGNIVYYVAKKFKAKFIVDIVDLWPESFVAYGLVAKRNPLLHLAYRAEYWLYRKADLLIFSMEGGKDYIKEKKWDIEQGGKIDSNKVFYINNGVDIKEFDFNKINHKVIDEDLENDENFKVIYIGSIRLANNIMNLIEAAEHLKNIPEIKILIYGDGEDRILIEKFCKVKQLDNVFFKQKWIELKYVPFILSKSSLNILNYKPSSILKYGGSQSKSFQYMASGKPICANIRMNYCPIEKFNIGIAEEFKDAKAYANAILSFYKMNKKDYNTICSNARKASENYDYELLTKRYIELIKRIV